MEAAMQTVQLCKQIRYTDFMLGEVMPEPDGGAAVNFVTPTGEVHSFPLNERARQELGKKLLAPSLAVAGAGGSLNGKPV
jgi:hypothetical protein